MTEQDPVMARIDRAQRLALGGDRAGARAAFEALWAELGDEGDPLHVVTLAHYMADVQDDPREEVRWDQRALIAATRLTGERAKRHHPSLSVPGFYPSLHLNLASGYEKLGNREAALEHLAAAEAALPDLPGGGYGDTIRGAIARLRDRLGAG